jgi:glyoxalase family protein
MNDYNANGTRGILGIHHVALVSSDAARSLDHYTRILGLSLLDSGSGEGTGKHLWLTSGHSHHGILLSLEERAGAAPGHEGVGGTHHFAVLVETRDALLRWKRRLVDEGIRVSGPFDRHYFESIYHRDPDGQVIEIATRGHGWTRDEAPEAIGSEHRDPPADMIVGNRDSARIVAETWPEPVGTIVPEMRLLQMHHITAIGDDIERTHAFVHDALGLRRVKRTSNFDMPDSFHWYWGVGDGEPGTVVTYFERRGAARVTPGPGQVAHYALGVTDEEALDELRARLAAAGLDVSAIEAGAHYSSIALRDPDGQRVEIATPFVASDTAMTTARQQAQA